MQVRSAIILSAGKGTRMGPIGEVLAKPVWPFFGKTLLDLQIEFLKSQFGITKFYINAHHLFHQLEKYEDENVKVIHEPILLDQGGGILNIIKKYSLWDEPLLINNADQLYFVSSDEYKMASDLLAKNDVILFGLNVNKSEKYNKLKIENDQLKLIIKNNEVREREFETYSGMALLRCAEQNYSGEGLSFFESVANYKAKEVLVKTVIAAEYYDFGKLDTYYHLCQKVLAMKKEGIGSKLMTFLKGIQIKIDISSEGLNFSSDPALVKTGRIRLNEGELYIERDNVISRLFN